MIHILNAIVGWLLRVPWTQLAELWLCYVALKLLSKLMNSNLF
ncbi:MAG: hypothetical protein P4L87_07740 [Formivibrio sp.]|nr:hypothetical protein [Formivibrio sp.]